MISKRRHANNNKPYEHREVAGLRGEANWEDYPNQAPDNVCMEMDFVSSLPGNNSPPMDLSDVVAATRNVSSLIIFLENTKKREHANPMEIKEVDTASIPKRQKVEQEKQVVQVKNSSMRGQVKKTSEKGKLKQGKQKQEQSKAAGLELQEYVFDGVATGKFASKEDWLETYRERADTKFNETVKLYEQVKQFPKPDVTLKNVRDHVKDTLSLAMTMGNKVYEVNVNLENIPTTDVIHLNRETSDILNTRFLKATI